MIHPFKGTKPEIDASALVVDSAQIIGDVKIGEESSVWFNAVIRGDVNFIRVGKRTNIQDGCVLHVARKTLPLEIGDEVTIGHNVTLHACAIGSQCLIGMSTNRVEIFQIKPYLKPRGIIGYCENIEVRATSCRHPS